MATQTVHRLLLLSLLAISATARPGRPFHPCQTLILFSTSTISSSFPLLQNPDNSSPQNPNPNNNFRRSQSITLFITEIRPVDFYPSIPTIDQNRDDSSLYTSSFRDRTRDILSVVGSLLFGVGCGALTAATMYLMWSLFAANRFDLRDDSDDESDGDEDGFEGDDVSPKKIGYVAIPAAADSDSPLVVAKEVV